MLKHCPEKAVSPSVKFHTVLQPSLQSWLHGRWYIKGTRPPAVGSFLGWGSRVREEDRRSVCLGEYNSYAGALARIWISRVLVEGGGKRGQPAIEICEGASELRGRGDSVQ